MPTPNARRSRERHLLERFLEVAHIEAVICAQSESPDFEIAIDGRKVGVELTEMFVPSGPSELSRQAAESITSRIVAKARQHYESRSHPPVHVTVAFCAGVDLRKIRRDEIAEALSNLVRRMPLNERGHTSWHNNYEDDTLESIAFVNVLPVPETLMAHWGVGRAGWVSPLSLEVLQGRVNEKNQRIEDYRKKHAELWLVVAIEGSKPSQSFDLSCLPDGSLISSRFDKTFFFCSVPPRVLPLGGGFA